MAGKSKNNDSKKLENLDEMLDDIDFTAVIARLSGAQLTEEQKTSCEKFDEVYDATHPES